jgi:hypothetical protein
MVTVQTPPAMTQRELKESTELSNPAGKESRAAVPMAVGQAISGPMDESPDGLEAASGSGSAASTVN